MFRFIWHTELTEPTVRNHHIIASVSGRLKDLAGQMKERRVWAVLVAYPSVTFVLLHAIEFFINHYGLDHRYLTAGLIVSLILFPAAFLWNWRLGKVGEQDFRPLEVGTYLVLGIVAVVVAAWLWRISLPAAVDAIPVKAPAVRTVAVLPLENPAGDAEIQYLCDGIAESLINWLAGIDNIRVISKSAAIRPVQPDLLPGLLWLGNIRQDGDRPALPGPAGPDQFSAQPGSR